MALVGALCGFREDRRLRRRLLTGLLLLGCHETPTEAPRLETSAFDRPQAVLFLEDGRLVVSNSGYRPDGWAPGVLSVIGPDGVLLQRVQTSWRNPQQLRLWRGGVLSVSTGALDLSDFERPTAAEPGGLELFDERRLDRRWAVEIPVTDTMAAPIGLAIGQDNQALVSSAVTNTVVPFDLTAGEAGQPLRFDGAERISLGAVMPWRDLFLLADFNEDRLFIFDQDGTPWPCGVELGESARDLEGAQSIAIEGDKAYILMALSGVARVVDLSTLRRDDPACAVQSETAFGPLGQVPNQLFIHDGRAFVVHSGDHNVVAYALDTGREVQRWALDPGSNPWHAAIDSTGGRLAVTEWGLNAVSVFDLESGERLWRLSAAPAQLVEPDVPATPDGPPAVFADEVVSAPGVRDPDLAVNGARGLGSSAGGADVAQLSGRPDGGDVLVLRWSDRRVLNGPGPDLVIFENAFEYSGGTFMDPVVVEVSADGERWVGFPHDYLAEDELAYQPDPSLWQGFAGRTPTVLSVEGTPDLDAFDVGAGGDRFDLEQLPDTAEGRRIKAEGFMFLRLSSARAQVNPDTGVVFPSDPVSNGADIDAAYARYLSP